MNGMKMIKRQKTASTQSKGYGSSSAGDVMVEE